MGGKRFRPRFTELEKRALLEAIGNCRKACINAHTHSLFDRKDVYVACTTIKAEIDKLAELLTGDRQYFWGKAHSSLHFTSPQTGDDN